MITEDYVSFEIAKLLKEKGFDEPTTGTYHKDGTFEHLSLNKWNSKFITPISAPTHQMAMKWLREEKDIIIVIQPEYFNAESICSAFGCDIWCNDNYEKLQGDFPSHEEAVEAALKYSLENLI